MPVNTEVGILVINRLSTLGPRALWSAEIRNAALAARCGSAYEFRRRGEISVANPHDSACGKTMDVLKHYHDELRDPRVDACLTLVTA
jgi:hypothetical protein